MIKAIVFDFDGMVFVADKMFSERLSEDYKIPSDKISEFFKNDFSKCQKGESDLRNAIKPYLEKWGWTEGADGLLDYWFGYGHLDNEIAKLIRLLRNKGITCMLGTNNDKCRMDYLEKKFELSELFDFIVASYEIGARKPESAFYDKIRETAGLQPKNIAVCDDKDDHVEKLENLGFVAIKYQGKEKFMQKIKNLGIII